MIADDAGASLLFFGVFSLLCLFATFWLIRLAVRYGVNDALRMNRSWLSQPQEREPR